MLTSLEIKSFAVIEHALFSPSEGLNVISGETGAGKSLLIDAIGLIMGQKASKDLVRSGCDSAYVEAVFSLEGDCRVRLKEILGDSGITPDDENLIISRTVSKDGKSLARINGSSVILNTLRSVSSVLVDIHGQNDTSVIFDPRVHIELLDSFGGKEIDDLLRDYRDKLSEYKELALKYKEMNALVSSGLADKDYLTFAVNEIRNAGFKEGEDEELFGRKKKLSADKANASLRDGVQRILCGTDDAGQTEVMRLNRAVRDLKKLAESDKAYEEILKRTESLMLDFEALSADYDRLAAQSEFDAGDLEQTEKRIGLLYELTSKYGKTISDVNKFADDAQEKLDLLEGSAGKLDELKLHVKTAEKELLESANKLSSKRKAFAEDLSEKITKELSELEISGASFGVNFSTRPKEKFFNKLGIDDVSFMFSANPGQPMKELSSVASGGEASRIMLAIKSILSKADKTPTLIFDEIDTGVSGSACAAISRKLKAISKEHQVLCVSHTAQLACAADYNFLISKSTDGVSTKTQITKLDSNGKISEVSRLLSGSDSAESIDLAREMISEFGG